MCELYPLRDAKTYFVIHNEQSTADHRKRIEKAMSRADDIRRVRNREDADFYVDFTEAGWVRVWGSGGDVGRWSLFDRTTTVTFPGTAHTTIVSAGRVTTGRTVVTSPRTAVIESSGDVVEGSEILFRLGVGRKIWRVRPCETEN